MIVYLQISTSCRYYLSAYVKESRRTLLGFTVYRIILNTTEFQGDSGIFSCARIGLSSFKVRSQTVKISAA